MSARLSSGVLTAWLLAGTLDITAAILYYTGASPARAARLLQGIASGLLGERAFAGGRTTMLLGLALHYFIALVWTLNLVVLPLSNVRHTPIQARPAVTAAVILVLCIGLPISLVLGRRFREPPATIP